MAKSSRPVSKIRDPESSCVLCVFTGRTRFRYCCRSMSDVGRPSIRINPDGPRLGRPSDPTGTLIRCLNFGSRYRSKRSGGSMTCMSESTNRRPSFIAPSLYREVGRAPNAENPLKEGRPSSDSGNALREARCYNRRRHAASRAQAMTVQGAQGFVEDPRNDTLLVYVNGELVPKADAKVSVFDSGFVLGDGVWDAFRLVGGTLVFMTEHLERLLEGARSIDIDTALTEKELADA